MYWNISNVPATWKDTVLDAVDDPPVSVHSAAVSFGKSNVSVEPVVTASGFGLRIKFAAALPGDMPLHIRLVNAKGEAVMDVKGGARRGERTVASGGLTTTPAAGLYIGIISIGTERFITSMVVGK